MIIGLTGKNASGKGEVASFLINNGFRYLSLSDVVREEVKSKRKQITRQLLVETSNELRQRYGSAVLAERIAKKVDPNYNYVIDSIRNPAEVKCLRRLKDFYLLFIDAEADIRFERIKKRNRESDPQTLQEFMTLEAKEADGGSPFTQQLNATIKLADAIITNNGTLEELHEQIRQVLTSFATKSHRPSWDEYFMSIAKIVATRSSCLKRKVGAIIVKDQRIISTGYNGTPRGITNCNEGGCPRCSQFVKEGCGLENCYCSHGEENAIVQAAYHGVRINGGTLYTTYSPCLACTKMIINSGLKEVIYNATYPMLDESEKLLKDAGVVIRKLETDAETPKPSALTQQD